MLSREKLLKNKTFQQPVEKPQYEELYWTFLTNMSKVHGLQMHSKIEI